MVSRAAAQRRYGAVRRCLHLGLALLAALGLVCSAVMCLLPEALAAALHDPDAAPALRTLGQAVLRPLYPQSAAEVLRQIGACETCSTWESAAGYGALSHTVTVSRGENLFPRIDAEKALSELEEAAAAAKKASTPRCC